MSQQDSDYHSDGQEPSGAHEEVDAPTTTPSSGVYDEQDVIAPTTTLSPHPVAELLPNVSYCVLSSPPWGEAIALGFQHYLVMLGQTVLIPSIVVPQMGGGEIEKAMVIQSLLLVAGINTMVQSFFGTRLPVVINASHTYASTTLSIVLAGRYNDIADPTERFLRIMRATQGAHMFASAIQIIIGFSGSWRYVVRFLSPLSAVPLVALSGFGLQRFGFPMLARCAEIGLPELAALVIFTQYLPHVRRGDRRILVLDRFAIIFSIVIIWTFAHVLTLAGAYKKSHTCRTDHARVIDGAFWFSIPYPFQWGSPTFDMGDALAMTVASLVALVESTGGLIAISRYASATPLPPSVLSRGIGWEGIGNLVSGMIGTGVGISTSIENAGLIGMTRVGSRRVVQISAGFMIFFSIFGKFGALFASIPASIFAALYCISFAYVGSGGLGLLQFCNLNSFRGKFILGFSIFMGFSIPQYFVEYGPMRTRARLFNDMVNVPFSSGAFVAGLLAVVLDSVLLRRSDSRTHRDRGMHWWDRFTSMGADSRSTEYYSLPF
ncbi:nucleobase-ascorbate transporter 7-like [Vicia villosa]|uniref:nucleobase-ascorbate transporter 7-like n=1 Tax=Vicia villosa TaxID=3911 RepID=UPI00273ADE9A|nr:nucleobase-ascorbate transporter 7-like [Vicia villosa]